MGISQDALTTKVSVDRPHELARLEPLDRQDLIDPSVRDALIVREGLGDFFWAGLLSFAIMAIFYAYALPHLTGRYYASSLVVGVSIGIITALQFIFPIQAMMAFLVSLPLLSKLNEQILPQVLGIPIPIESLAILILLGGNLLRCILRNRLRIDLFIGVWALFLLYLLTVTAASSFTVIGSIKHALSITFLGVIIPAAHYFNLVNSINQKRHRSAVILSVLLLLTISCLFAAVQPFVSGGSLHYWYCRNPSFYYNPNIFGEVIVLCYPFALYSARVAGRRVWRRSAYLTIFLSLFAALMTGSRGTLIVAAAQTAYFFRHKCRLNVLLASFRNSGVILKVAAISATVGAGASLKFLLHTSLRRFFIWAPLDPASSLNRRLDAWRSAIQMGVRSPLGVGLGGFSSSYHRIYPHALVEPLGSAHNLFLNTFAEAGFLGLALLVASLLVGYIQVKPTNHSNPTQVLLKQHLLSGLAGYFVYAASVGAELSHRNINVPIILVMTIIALGSADTEDERALSW